MPITHAEVIDVYGSITTGKVADLVLLDGNPLEDITATRAIPAVVRRGRLFDRPALDTLLKKTRHKVSEWNRQAAAGR